jgi:stage V sporulation protein B
MSLTSVIDSMLAVKRLNDACVGITYFAVNEAAPVAMTIYGAYMAKAITFFNVPPTIIYPFAISIIPAISGAEETKDRSALKKTMDFTFRIVSVICLPCAFGLGVLAKPIINLLFSSNDPIFINESGNVLLSNNTAAPMLSILAPAIVFSGLISVSGAMLQASGHERKSILSTCCGVGTKALAVWLLIGIPKIGHYGIPLSTLLCYFVMFCFNLFFISHYLDYRLDFKSIMLKPLLSSILCGITAGGGYFLLERVIPPSIATISSIGLAALVYVIALFKSGGFAKDDVLMLPKGDLILKILTKIHLLQA